ncbi:MAG: hypothetical protein CVT93_10380 [Bacteroidetes bacterium HGW-Bacteroidetes-10]|nr:MAG: hypothetical protein CVT93_10380 [Bacteroidetes bacterium HGW-Bacteroidetes-10]
MKTVPVVFDLHIEKIAKSYRSFTPADTLMYQTEYFIQKLNSYRLQKGKKIDFVHGSGKGVLRGELIAILTQKYPSYTYEDAPFAVFGYKGAIRVTIK